MTIANPSIAKLILRAVASFKVMKSEEWETAERDERIARALSDVEAALCSGIQVHA